MNQASQSQASRKPRPLLPKPPPEGTMKPSLVVKLKVPSYFEKLKATTQQKALETGEGPPPPNAAQAQNVPKTNQTEPIPEPVIDTSREGNRTPNQLNFQSSSADPSGMTQPQDLGNHGLDPRDMASQAQSKPTAQQGESRVDSIVSTAGIDTSVAHNAPNHNIPQGTPAANALEGVLYAAHKRKRNETEDPSGRFAKYSKPQIENELIAMFQKEHGREPGFYELHSTEIRRGIPPEDRIWTTIEEQVLIDQGLRPVDNLLG